MENQYTKLDYVITALLIGLAIAGATLALWGLK
jgi:hypothetical protein